MWSESKFFTVCFKFCRPLNHQYFARLSSCKIWVLEYFLRFMQLIHEKCSVFNFFEPSHFLPCCGIQPRKNMDPGFSKKSFSQFSAMKRKPHFGITVFTFWLRYDLHNFDNSIGCSKRAYKSWPKICVFWSFYAIRSQLLYLKHSRILFFCAGYIT